MSISAEKYKQVNAIPMVKFVKFNSFETQRNRTRTYMANFSSFLFQIIGCLGYIQCKAKAGHCVHQS